MPGSRSIKDGFVMTTVGPWDVEVSYNCYDDPGNTSGPIDRCYPPDREMEVTAVKYGGENVMHLLTEDVIGDLEVVCWEDASAAWSGEDREYEDD